MGMRIPVPGVMGGTMELASEAVMGVWGIHVTAALPDRVPFNPYLAFSEIASICDGPAGGADRYDGGLEALVISSLRMYSA